MGLCDAGAAPLAVLCTQAAQRPAHAKQLVRSALSWLGLSSPICTGPHDPRRLAQVSPEGKVLQTLMDPTGARVASVASILDLGDRLVLGNLGGDYVSVVPLSGEGTGPAAAAPTQRQAEGSSEL